MNTTLDETKRVDFLTNNILVSSQLENEKKFNREELDFQALFRIGFRHFVVGIPPEFWRSHWARCRYLGDPRYFAAIDYQSSGNAVKYLIKKT